MSASRTASPSSDPAAAARDFLSVLADKPDELLIQVADLTRTMRTMLGRRPETAQLLPAVLDRLAGFGAAGPDGRRSMLMGAAGLLDCDGIAGPEPSIEEWIEGEQALDTPVQYVKGVGERIAARLAAREIRTVNDLLDAFPRRYLDLRQPGSLSGIVPDTICSAAGRVLSIRRSGGGRGPLTMVVEDGTGQVALTWFRHQRLGLEKRFQPGDPVSFRGKATLFRGRLQMVHPELTKMVDLIEAARTDGGEEACGLSPVYPEIPGLHRRRYRDIVSAALDRFGRQIPEFLPASIRREASLCLRAEAYSAIHRPPAGTPVGVLNLERPGAWPTGQRRLIFDELFLFILGLKLNRRQERATGKRPLDPRSNLLGRALQSLPFRPTGAQERAIREIVDDFRSPRPMRRLLQGDVGSGKTLVALLSALVVIDNGRQTALMAPTEILALQHHRTAVGALEPLGVRVGLLTGSTPAAEARRICNETADGRIQLCIGTHALIQERVAFANLGYIVVDEQHRFGVVQRAAMHGKGESPEFLVMSATPIPRSLAMTLYGDLDVSIIDELPPGRTPVRTRLLRESERGRMHALVLEQTALGRQAFIVYPLIDESDALEMHGAVVMHAELAEGPFCHLRTGLLHGRMKADERDRVMASFRDGTIDVLVSTTVIEVGVDVPNATCMVVEHAERFGLSQLHQLRGRVGRGSAGSVCLLMAGDGLSPEAYRRLSLMESVNDGFRVAEEDLAMRGSGDIFGTRQAGLPGFRLADIVRDARLVELASRAAGRLLSEDPGLALPRHRPLARHLERFWHGRLRFGEIG